MRPLASDVHCVATLAGIRPPTVGPNCLTKPSRCWRTHPVTRLTADWSQVIVWLRAARPDRLAVPDVEATSAAPGAARGLGEITHRASGEPSLAGWRDAPLVRFDRRRDVVEVSAWAWPGLGVADLVVADPVDVPQTEPVGILIDDAPGHRLDVVQPAARSVETEDPDGLAGVHAVTIS